METPQNIETALEDAKRTIRELTVSLKKEKQARQYAEGKTEVIKAAADLMDKLQDEVVEDYEKEISKLQTENKSLRQQIELLKRFNPPMAINSETDDLEEWRPVKGYEGHYEVSNQGRVRSLKRPNERYVMTQYSRKSGILGLSLSKNGRSTGFDTHYLVADAFIPNPEHFEYVSHIDGNKENNRVENLRWVKIDYTMQSNDYAVKEVEEWRPVKGFDFYEISNLGRVKSLKSPDKPKIMSPYLGSHGYMVLTLRNNGRSQKVNLHRIVADAFLPPRNYAKQLTFIDGDSTNCRADNLKWKYTQ